MILYVAAVVLLGQQGLKLRLRSFNRDYLSKDGTDAVRGIFILLIFAAHFNGYVDLTAAPMDAAYHRIWTAMGQMVVTCPLFYSGYGVALSAATKGDSYVRAMPGKRILPTLLIYDLSALLYLLLQLWRGKSYDLKQFVLTMFAWSSFGNSNWYLFAILGCYLISWLALRGKKLNGVTVSRITLGVMAFLLAMRCAGRDPWWYNTLLCYPMGMYFFLYKDKIDQVMAKNRYYWPILLVTMAGCRAAHKFWVPSSGPVYMLTMLLFTLCVVFATMKVELCSPVLKYCGRHLQGLYLIHRIPFIFLGDYLPWRTGPGIYVYFVLSLVGIFVLEFLFSKTSDYLRTATPVVADK